MNKSSPLPITKLTPNDIALLPLIRFTGSIHLIRSLSDWNRMLTILDQVSFLGLDTEKKPSFRKGEYHPVSLLQIATENDAFIVQLKFFKRDWSPVEQFLSSPQWTKIGLAFHDDLKDLQKLGPFIPQNFVNLDQLAKEQGYTQTGLRSLVASLLKSRLSKTHQKSNWAQDPLAPEQLLYAATDAWVCLKLFPHLSSL
jgi:ribonuclease D